MSSSIIACNITNCEMISCAICHCCRENLCLDHLKEHRDRLNVQLIPLIDQVNTLEENFDRFEMSSTPAYRTIEQWREHGHQTIDDFCRKLHERMSVEKKEKTTRCIETIHRWLEYSIRKQGATRERIEMCTEGLKVVQQHYEELSMTQIKMKPLTIDENIIIESDLVSSPKSGRVRQQSQKNYQDECTLEAVSTSTPLEDSRIRMNRSGIEIFFQYIGKTHSLVITRFDSILQIKQKIADKIGIPPQQQCLKLTGKILRNQDWIKPVEVLQHDSLQVSFLVRPKLGRNKTDEPKTKKMKTSET